MYAPYSVCNSVGKILSDSSNSSVETLLSAFNSFSSVFLRVKKILSKCLICFPTAKICTTYKSHSFKYMHDIVNVAFIGYQLTFLFIFELLYFHFRINNCNYRTCARKLGFLLEVMQILKLKGLCFTNIKVSRENNNHSR